ncbi:MAG: alpha-galactosidase [Chloroflexi bacterium]|nr:alpha-galactosidase [Chloroflexota bacterium]
MRLDQVYGAATSQLSLTNLSHQPSPPFSCLSLFSLKLVDLPGPARIMSSAGGGYSDAVGYPGRDAYWTRWDMPLPNHGVTLSSGPEDGLSSSQDLPIVMVAAGPDWDAPGFFFGMEWSGTWQAYLRAPGQRRRDGGPQNRREYPPGLEIDIGPQVTGLVLEPGETLELPAIHLGCFEGGFEAGTNALRHYITDQITPKRSHAPVSPPVVCVQWPGIRSYIEADIYRQADAAADLGAEYFVFDSEWFGAHPAGIGNWEPDLARMPHGLEALSAHVRSKGMGFGLFFDGECAAENTKLLREHPEFFYPGDTGPWMPPGSRLLNYGLPQAADYMVQLVSDLIERQSLPARLLPGMRLRPPPIEGTHWPRRQHARSCLYQPDGRRIFPARLPGRSGARRSGPGAPLGVRLQKNPPFVAERLLPPLTPAPVRGRMGRRAVLRRIR